MLRSSFALLCLAGLLGCTAPNVTATIEGVPVCSDFELGAARSKMQGGLRKPVLISILDDDGDLVSKRLVFGRRDASDAPPPLLVEDKDGQYVLRFAECSNEFAPQPVSGAPQQRDTTQYQCFEPQTYADVPFEVRKGDGSSRTLQFVAAPESRCWASETPPSPLNTVGTGSAPNTGASSAAPSANLPPSGSSPSATATASAAP